MGRIRPLPLALKATTEFASDDDVILILRGHKGSVASAAMSSDEAIVITTAHDNVLRLFDGTTGELRRTFQPCGRFKVNHAIFAPSDSRLLVACADRCARLLDSSTGACESVFSDGHRGGV